MVEKLGISWDERYGELKGYMEEHGDCNVPDKWEKNPKLATWVSAQRAWNKEGLI